MAPCYQKQLEKDKAVHTLINHTKQHEKDKAVHLRAASLLERAGQSNWLSLRPPGTCYVRLYGTHALPIAACIEYEQPSCGRDAQNPTAGEAAWLPTALPASEAVLTAPGPCPLCLLSQTWPSCLRHAGPSRMSPSELMPAAAAHGCLEG
jgi:hypothetical protein